MAEEIRNKFVTWTLNVRGGGQRRHQRRGTCGVGVNLALVVPATTSSSSSSSSSSSPPPRRGDRQRVGVDSVVPDGPAFRAGLRSGDVVIDVDGRVFDDVPGLLPEDVASAIRGPMGTVVTIVVERDGGRRVVFALTREPIGAVVVNSPSSSSSTSASPPVSSPTRDGGEERGKAGVGSTTSELRRQTGSTTTMTTTAATAKARPSNPTIVADGPPDAVVRRDLPATFSEGEEEEEEGGMTSSAESADQFDAVPAVLAAGGNRRGGAALVASRRTSSIGEEDVASSEIAISEEEKEIDVDDNANDDDDDNGGTSSVVGSVGDGSSQWEMLSERSGSAIVVSFSGSYCGSSSYMRSPSPSVLKNKFVLAESNGEEYINHVVLPTDTLQGLCLAYKISATRLRMENNFSGNSLHMAPKRLRIPTNAAAVPVGTHEKGGTMIRTQDRTSREYKLYAFVAELPSMELVEAKAYLDLSNWDLDEALRSAREDEGWSMKGGFEPLVATAATAVLGDGGGGGYDASTMMDAVAKPKSLTARDIYACPPPFDGHGFELKDVKTLKK